MMCERGYKPPRREVLTEHFKNERLDRYVFIVTTVGLGEPVVTKKVLDKDGRWSFQTLTSTGVVIIRNLFDEIVTMFIAKHNQAAFFYDGKLPMVMEGVINRNVSRNYHNLQNGSASRQK